MIAGRLRRVSPLPGRYSGVFEVLADGEPCALRVRRQAGTGWLVETGNGFIPVTGLAAAEAVVLEHEIRRIADAREILDEFLREVGAVDP